MQIEVFSDADSVASEAARFVARCGREAIEARGRFSLALSGGSTPWQMLRKLGPDDLDWSRVEVFQVDERVAPAGDPERNRTHLDETLTARLPIPPAQVHAMPVEASDLAAAAAEYAAQLGRVTGQPAVLDLVHLGLGPDGHTASLVPGDAALEVDDADVTMTGGPYQGRLRMTLTYPLIARARCILWLLTGAGKAEMLVRLRDANPTIPAGRVASEQAVVFADEPAAADL